MPRFEMLTAAQIEQRDAADKQKRREVRREKKRHEVIYNDYYELRKLMSVALRARYEVKDRPDDVSMTQVLVSATDAFQAAFQATSLETRALYVGRACFDAAMRFRDSGVPDKINGGEENEAETIEVLNFKLACCQIEGRVQTASEVEVLKELYLILSKLRGYKTIEIVATTREGRIAYLAQWEDWYLKILTNSSDNIIVEEITQYRQVNSEQLEEERQRREARLAAIHY